MSKNIFNVLAMDSDEEGNKNAQQQQQSKQQVRQKDKMFREGFGTGNEKNNTQKIKKAPRNKGDYKPNQKRPYDRHSGTGRQAFGNKHQGGFNKGTDSKNYRNNQEELKDDVVNKDQTQGEESKPEPPKKVLTLE